MDLIKRKQRLGGEKSSRGARNPWRKDRREKVNAGKVILGQKGGSFLSDTEKTRSLSLCQVKSEVREIEAAKN